MKKYTTSVAWGHFINAEITAVLSVLCCFALFPASFWHHHGKCQCTEEDISVITKVIVVSHSTGSLKSGKNCCVVSVICFASLSYFDRSFLFWYWKLSVEDQLEWVD